MWIILQDTKVVFVIYDIKIPKSDGTPIGNMENGMIQLQTKQRKISVYLGCTIEIIFSATSIDYIIYKFAEHMLSAEKTTNPYVTK